MEQFIGDYIGIVAGARTAWVVWTDTRSATACAAVNAYRSAVYAGTKTAVISNTWGPPIAYGAKRMKAIFDAIVRSDEVGLRKPDPAIYLLTAERLEVRPAECVFVDDLLQNVEGARGVGMHAFVHRNADFTVPRLEELFGVSLPA